MYHKYKYFILVYIIIKGLIIYKIDFYYLLLSKAKYIE